MTETTAQAAPLGAGFRARGSDEWDARVRSALSERRSLTHAGVSGMTDDDLVALAVAVGAVRKDADRMMAVVAAEQAVRSRAKARKVGLARGRGKGDERGLVSSQTGGSAAESSRLIELGETLRDAERAGRGEPAVDPASEQPVAVFPEVARAVNAGELSVEASAMITRMLKRVRQRVAPPALAKAERRLVFAARHMRLEKLAGLITRTEERLDAEHREALAKERRERRFLRVGESADGMVTVNGRLDPENGAPLVAVMQAMVNQNFRLRKRMQEAANAGEAVVVDERTPEQVRADAMGDFARHLLGCEVSVLPKAGVTLVVRTGLEELREGLGGAAIDGHAASLDAGALRRAAAAADVIPQVLGGKSEVLDQGVKRRLFTFEQKLALVQRDGGCAMCGAPPSWCDAHHIVHWSRGGRTDLANGVMLCVRCHHDVHRAGWIIDATASEVWFTPPAEVDPARRRRPGGRRLFDVYPLEQESPPGEAKARGESCACVRYEPAGSTLVEEIEGDGSFERYGEAVSHGEAKASNAPRPPAPCDEHTPPAHHRRRSRMPCRTAPCSHAPPRLRRPPGRRMSASRRAGATGPPPRLARLHSQATRRS